MEHRGHEHHDGTEVHLPPEESNRRRRPPQAASITVAAEAQPQVRCTITRRYLRPSTRLACGLNQGDEPPRRLSSSSSRRFDCFHHHPCTKSGKKTSPTERRLSAAARS